MNKEATGCPNCGSSPNLSAAEAEAIRRARAEKGALVPNEPPPLLPGWSRRIRVVTLLPALLSAISVLIYGVGVYRQYHVPNIATDSRVIFALGLAIVCLLSLVPALLAVLPRRLPLALAVAASALGLPLAVLCSLWIPWSGPLPLVVVGFGYVPALAIVRSILQRKADKRKDAVRGIPINSDRRPALRVAKSWAAGLALAVAVLFLSGVVLVGVFASTWSVHTRSTKTSPDGTWSLVINSIDEGALGGSTSVEVRPAKGHGQTILLYEGDWLPDSEVSWSNAARTVFIGDRVINPFERDGVTKPTAP